MNVGDLVRKRSQEIDKELPKLEQELESLSAKVRDLRQEQRTLTTTLRQLERKENGASESPVDNDQVLAAVKELGGKSISSGAVADHLKVTKRNVARKLRKLVDDGMLSGNPEKGYTVLKSRI